MSIISLLQPLLYLLHKLSSPRQVCSSLRHLRAMVFHPHILSCILRFHPISVVLLHSRDTSIVLRTTRLEACHPAHLPSLAILARCHRKTIRAHPVRDRLGRSVRVRGLNKTGRLREHSGSDGTSESLLFFTDFPAVNASHNPYACLSHVSYEWPLI